MQVYMWNDIPCLNQYENGLAIAFATTKEEAVYLVITYVSDNANGLFYFDEEQLEELRGQLETLEPVIHTNPMGFAQYGSG